MFLWSVFYTDGMPSAERHSCCNKFENIVVEKMYHSGFKVWIVENEVKNYSCIDKKNYNSWFYNRVVNYKHKSLKWLIKNPCGTDAVIIVTDCEVTIHRYLIWMLHLGRISTTLYTFSHLFTFLISRFFTFYIQQCVIYFLHVLKLFKDILSKYPYTVLSCSSNSQLF